MDERTSDIIMLCKNKHEFGKGTHSEIVAKYMADRCMVPVEYYSDKLINDIILQAAYDYIDGVTEGPPSSFFKQAQRTYDFFNESAEINRGKTPRVTWAEAICMTFANTRVKASNGKYINGFTEENTKFVRKTRNGW